MSGEPELPERASVDSGVLLAHFLGEEEGELVRRWILAPGGATAYVSGTALAELFYVLCRRKGEAFAEEAVRALLDSGYLSLAEGPWLDAAAGRLKCERSVSLADCYVLGLAEATSSAAVFARKEEDLAKELSRRGFGLTVLFLQDLAPGRGGR